MKTALVTGASAGIGKATVKQLLADGYTVYAVARRLERMDDLKALGAKTIKMDITKDEDVVAVVEQINQESGGVDILVNNAGFGLNGTVEETTIDDARYQFEVNLFGLARLTQLVIPHMRQQRAGKIINVTSVGGKIHVPLGSWYIGTKHALEGWSDCLRLELKQFNIDVIVVEPGAIKTEFGDVLVPPLLERSGSGPYKDMVHKLAKRVKEMESANQGSPPSVIASVISKSVKARKPKTRYAKGKYARTMLLTRRWCSDRMVDRFMLNFIK